MSANDTYQDPLNSRYSSSEMKYLFSPRNRFSTWRQLWIWLAESEKELGLDITDKAIEQMKAAQIIQDEEFKVAAEEEKKAKELRRRLRMRRGQPLGSVGVGEGDHFS